MNAKTDAAVMDRSPAKASAMPMVNAAPAGVPAESRVGTTALLDAITAAASNPAVDIEKMERLFEMHQRMVAGEAKAAFYAALAEVQAKVPIILNNSDNTHTRSRYADLAAVNEKLVPIYTKHGFALSITSAKAERADEIRWVATLGHRMGHERDYWVDLPSDTAGAKGNSNKNAIQGVMSSSTYARRYLEFLIFNVATADSDGNASQEEQPTITDSQRADFETAIDAAADEDSLTRTYQSLKTACEAINDEASFKALKAKVRAKGKALGLPDDFLRTKKPAYNAGDFDVNFASWRKAIEGGKRTPDDIINMIQSKHTLTEEQQKKIRGIKKPAAKAA
jgi:hypothetical protein